MKSAGSAAAGERRLALSEVLDWMVADGVDHASLKSGDAVTLTYHQAVATQMLSTPQPITDPAPAP